MSDDYGGTPCHELIAMLIVLALLLSIPISLVIGIIDITSGCNIHSNSKCANDMKFNGYISQIQIYNNTCSECLQQTQDVCTNYLTYNCYDVYVFANKQNNTNNLNYIEGDYCYFQELKSETNIINVQKTSDKYIIGTPVKWFREQRKHMKYTDKCEFSTILYDRWMTGVIALSYFGSIVTICVIIGVIIFCVHECRKNNIVNVNVDNINENITITNRINITNTNRINITNTNHEIELTIEELNGIINNTVDINENITNTNHEIEELNYINTICDIENNITEDSQENIKNKNTEECCICIIQYNQKYALVPCGHTQMCFNCYNKLQQKKCPLCKKQIERIIKIY